MQVNLSNYNQNNLKQSKKNIVRNVNYSSNQYHSSMSFKGVNLGENGSKMAKGVINGAKELIDGTRNFMVNAFKKGRANVDEANSSFDSIGNILHVTPEKIVTEEELQKSNELLYQKEMELLNLEHSVINLKSTVRVNEALVDALPGQLAELEPAREIERHRLIKMQNPDLKLVGFEKIAGYNQDKQILQTFFFRNIDLEKQGKPAHVPNIIVFFGPTGNGKTVISLAVAEETGCVLKKVDCGLRISDKSRNEFMGSIEKEAQTAEERFRTEGKRTILFVDELTKVVSKDSNILDKFNKFASSCSEKYHCTIFGATNHMEQLGVNTSIVKPVIMAIEPPNKENAKAIFQHYLKGIKTLGNIDFDLLANKLMSVGQQRSGKYSNAQIEQVVNYSAKTGKNGISQQDILDCIVEGNPSRGFNPPTPTIDKEKQEIFDSAYRKFMQ